MHNEVPVPHPALQALHYVRKTLNARWKGCGGGDGGGHSGQTLLLAPENLGLSDDALV